MTAHGTLARYSRHGCRCPACRQANTAHQRSSRHHRYAQRIKVNGRLQHPNPPSGHGRPSTYTNYGCRCRGCSDTWSIYLQASRERASRGYRAPAAARVTHAG